MDVAELREMLDLAARLWNFLSREDATSPLVTRFFDWMKHDEVACFFGEYIISSNAGRVVATSLFHSSLVFLPRQTGNLRQLWVDRMDTNHWMPQPGWVTWR